MHVPDLVGYHLPSRQQRNVELESSFNSLPFSIPINTVMGSWDSLMQP